MPTLPGAFDKKVLSLLDQEKQKNRLIDVHCKDLSARCEFAVRRARPYVKMRDAILAAHARYPDDTELSDAAATIQDMDPAINIEGICISAEASGRHIVLSFLANYAHSVPAVHAQAALDAKAKYMEIERALPRDMLYTESAKWAKEARSGLGTPVIVRPD